MRRAVFLIWLIWLLFIGVSIGLTNPPAVTAQSAPDPIPEAEYWARLERSAALLAASSDPAATAEQVNALWQFSTVRLADGRVITLNLSWLRLPLVGATAADIDQRLTRVLALLNYRDQMRAAADTTAAQDALARVLQDERFDYNQAQRPAPPPAAETTRAPTAALGAFSRVILLGIGLLAVLAALIYLARGLRVQPAALRDPAASSDDPVTAEEALSSAAASQQVKEYRAAIRYLTLSSLLLLSERGVLDYDPALTNREHLAQVRDHPAIFELLSAIVARFDSVWYGFAPVDDAVYQAFRQRVQQLEQLTERPS